MIIVCLILVGIFSLNILAQSSSTPIFIQQPNKDIFDYILFLVQLLGVFGLFLYVYKTWEIASANKKSAEMSQKAIEISQETIELSRQSMEFSQKEAQKSFELSQAVLEEMREARIQEILPHIVVYFDMPYGDSWIMFLIVKNTGKTAARNIEIVFNPPLQSGFGNEIHNFDISLIKNGISSLAPNQEIRTPFDAITNYFDSRLAKRLNGKLPTKYEITISYSSLFEEKRAITNQIIDFSMFKDLSVLQEKGKKDLIKAVETISESSKQMERSLESLSQNIMEGIWLKNSDYLNSDLSSSPEIWKFYMLSKLSEFKIIWEFIYAGKYNKPVRFHTENLKSRISIISSQFVIINSKCPPTVSNELKHFLITISVKLNELSEWQFYDDSDNGFNEAGNEISKLTDTAIEKIESEIK